MLVAVSAQSCQQGVKHAGDAGSGAPRGVQRRGDVCSRHSSCVGQQWWW